ncbi:MAG: type III pantothenate kinase [Bdellovibrionales bacterium]
MLLVIDAGNTNTVFALFDGRDQKGLWRISTNAQRTCDEYAVFLKPLMMQTGVNPAAVTDAIIGSVVPDLNFNLIKLCVEHFSCEPLCVGNKNVETGVQIDIDRPEELGADRLINAAAGIEKYGASLMVIDFGTATTFDLINKEGIYCGGAIAPGINLSLRALHMAAAKLPSVAIEKPPRAVAKNTITAIQSGVFWGYVGLVEGLIRRMKDEMNEDMTVVATGGLAPLFTETIKEIDYADNNLTLQGLALIFEKNKQPIIQKASKTA